MKRVKFSASPAALLLYAFIYYILDNETLPALLLPVAYHYILILINYIKG